MRQVNFLKMTIVSTKEFNTNQKKYFDMALNDHVIVKRGRQMFIIRNFMPNDDPDDFFEPDEDFYRSIPIEEVRDSIVEYIRKKHAK